MLERLLSIVDVCANGNGGFDESVETFVVDACSVEMFAATINRMVKSHATAQTFVFYVFHTGTNLNGIRSVLPTIGNGIGLGFGQIEETVMILGYLDGVVRHVTEDGGREFVVNLNVTISICLIAFFGVGIGVITMLIRYFGAYPEGVSFAILIMNSVVPLLNKWFHTKKYGRA